mgnify:CR=1 FL=1
MPDALFVLPQMAPYPALQSTWPESAPDLGVVAGAEQNRRGILAPPDLDSAVSLELEDEDVGSFAETGRELGRGEL